MKQNQQTMGDPLMATPYEEEGPVAPTYKDSWCAVLFFVHVAVVGYFGLTKGLDSIKHQTHTPTPVPTPAPSDHYDPIGTDDLKHMASICGGMIMVAAALSVLWITIMTKLGESLIKCSIFMNIALYLVAAAAYVMMKQTMAALVFAALAALTFCYYNCVKSRIPFASANLAIACSATQKHGATKCVAFFMIAVQAVWCVLWGLCSLVAFKGGDTTTTEKNPVCAPNADSAFACQSCATSTGYDCAWSTATAASEQCMCSETAKSVSGLLYFALLVSFYWGMQVARNVVHTTTAGTVASWWFQPHNDSPVGGAFKRSVTTSFGSICLGSLIVAILKALTEMAREANRRGGAAACLAQCILSILTGLMEYFNKWAFVYVGIYGYGFKQAGKAVFELFKERGWDAIINDNLIENVLGLGSLVVGVLTAGIADLIVFLFQKDFGWDGASTNINMIYLITGVVSGLIGMSLCMIMMSIIDSAVATVFVCWAENPSALQTGYPDWHGKLMSAWCKAYPQAMQKCGYQGQVSHGY